jgi:hypothetical protein
MRKKTLRKALERATEAAEPIVKTTVNLAGDLWKDVKIAAIKRGVTFTEVVDSALREWLESAEKEKSEKKE